MADTTTYNDTLTRDETADLLQELARELRGTGASRVTVGNKTVTLEPADEIDYDLEVEERSPMLGGKHEEISISIEWAVKKEPQE
ncbi:amphi-Trp domain-containing protein [Natronosalvus vescus]|uniref:amphi-Trp domain-containing protein n=1 Tax=Natronosalvus vescus TaxID=2953881 RepID=UPI00209109CA|nr:amphi-Trp domain-containing protein [Natronosalvus vescus]